MAIRVTVSSPHIDTALDLNPKRTTIRAVGIGYKGSLFADLPDVDASSSDDGDTVVFDDVQNKYVVKVLPLVDGGTF
jgi:hypothetical protein